MGLLQTSLVGLWKLSILLLFEQILKLLVFLYCISQALSRASLSTFFTSQAETPLKLFVTLQARSNRSPGARAHNTAVSGFCSPVQIGETAVCPWEERLSCVADEKRSSKCYLDLNSDAVGVPD